LINVREVQHPNKKSDIPNIKEKVLNQKNKFDASKPFLSLGCFLNKTIKQFKSGPSPAPTASYLHNDVLLYQYSKEFLYDNTSNDKKIKPALCFSFCLSFQT